MQITTAGMERFIEELLQGLDAAIAPKTVILRNDTPARALEGLDSYVRVVKGEAPERISVEENGVLYLAEPQAGQKSGWYYDQGENRAFIARLAKGRRVLDAYCYSGGFSVLAAVRGAERVTGLDSSESALKLAAEAAEANGVAERCRFVRGDVFEELGRLADAGERFDIVICDPPPFAPSRKDLESGGARLSQARSRMAACIVTPGGFLMLAISCVAQYFA